MASEDRLRADSEVVSSTKGSTEEVRNTESDVSAAFMNAMKSRKRTVSIGNTEVQSVSGCTTVTESTIDPSNVKTSRKSSMANPLLRRRSTLKGLAQGITGLLKMRRLTVPSVKPQIKLENTYKMSPDAGDHIVPSKIEQIMEQILKNELDNKEYNSNLAGDMACRISAKIKNKVKEMNFERYRLICQVVVTQVKDQGLEAASRCLWDASCDNYTTVSYKNESIAAIAMLYGVYLE